MREYFFVSSIRSCVYNYHFLRTEIFHDPNISMSSALCFCLCAGVSSCVLALSAYMCGAPDIPIYDGSWSEWSKRAKADYIEIEGMSTDSTEK